MPWEFIIPAAFLGASLGFLACSLCGGTSSREGSAMHGCSECTDYVMNERDIQMRAIRKKR
jgi:hypothetical protein